MDDYVLNEYVHVDRVQCTGNYFLAVYEPLDEAVLERSLGGNVIIADTQLRIPFRQGNYGLLIDSDDLLSGQLVQRKVISLLWRDPPPEHFLTVSYTIGESEPSVSYILDAPISKINWLKEGF